jgi:hypothetical protein
VGDNRGSLGYAFDSCGNAGFYFSWGGGVGVGLGGSFTGDAYASNATGISDLAGAFVNDSVGPGDGMALTLPTAYASNKNSLLVAVRLNAGDCGWGGRPDDPADPWVLQWFLVAPDGSVRRVGGFEELLDAGDYDNDGRSETIFFSTRSEHSDAYREGWKPVLAPRGIERQGQDVTRIAYTGFWFGFGLEI